MDAPWTIRRVLGWMAEDFAGRGIDSPRLDAEVLVAHALSTSRVGLYLDLDRVLTPDELARIRSLVGRRRAREPVAYILGRKEFFGRPFVCGPGTLVPRPETETLVERALALLPADAAGPVLDLCTGTGAVGLTLAAERPALRVELTDLSEVALETARRNAAALSVEGRVLFHRGDLFAALPTPRRFALVVANPPYVADAEVARLMPEVAAHEPRLALAAGRDGLDVIRRIVGGVRTWLEPGGSCLLEVGDGQAAAVLALAATLEPPMEAAAYPDLGGTPRVVAVLRAPGDVDTAPAAPQEDAALSEADSGSEVGSRG